MKAKVSLKTVIVSALLLVCGLNASADNKSNLIYNSEEVNGMKVAETVTNTLHSLGFAPLDEPGSTMRYRCPGSRDCVAVCIAKEGTIEKEAAA